MVSPRKASAHHQTGLLWVPDFVSDIAPGYRCKTEGVLHTSFTITHTAIPVVPTPFLLFPGSHRPSSLMASRPPHTASVLPSLSNLQPALNNTWLHGSLPFPSPSKLDRRPYLLPWQQHGLFSRGNRVHVCSHLTVHLPLNPQAFKIRGWVLLTIVDTMTRTGKFFSALE